jgi:hypothetical protein
MTISRGIVKPEKTTLPPAVEQVYALGQILSMDILRQLTAKIQHLLLWKEK